MLLYLRMIVVTIVSLYTARLILQLLGVEDYGISNVVGGIVGFMSIITATMSSATQRFLAYDLGTNDLEQYKRTYSMLMYIFAIFCGISVVLLELIGPYCIQKYLVIPPDRLYAAQWLFQFSIVNFVMTTMTIPQTASIISYEKMGIYAYFTFLDVAFKLVAVLILYITPIDKLITYGITSMLFQIITFGIILLFCLKKLEGCRIIKFWDKSLFKRMAGYAGWNMFGSATTVMNQQGQAILLNVFFGPVVNAAKAIADKIYQTVNSFASNFFMAINPQIIKSYAAGDIGYTKTLVIKGSKFSFYMLMILSLPLIFNMDGILNLWLGNDMVSDEMIRFSQLTLIYALVNTLESPITQAVRATGNIRKYQISVGLQTLCFIPIAYIAFRLGADAIWSMVILILIYSIVQITRFIIVKPILNLSLSVYCKEVLFPIGVTFALSALVLFLIGLLKRQGLFFLFLSFAIDFLFVTCVSFIIGLNRNERQMVIGFVKNKFNTRRDER